MLPDSVVRKFRITAADGKNYETTHYNLDVIISVGYRVKSQRGTQFRIWATPGTGTEEEAMNHGAACQNTPVKVRVSWPPSTKVGLTKEGIEVGKQGLDEVRAA